MANELNPIPERCFELAVRVVKLCRHLEKHSSTARTIARQLLRSGTSIGANVEEGQSAESKPDFAHKYAVALKEARETKYWLRLLAATETVAENELAAITKEADEICRILGASITKVKRNSEPQ
ncbi:MAG: four helix bundle protein [Planctomycetes bacterium]|nr:four helix bundle protein [Planctomycetota bacterium]